MRNANVDIQLKPIGYVSSAYDDPTKPSSKTNRAIIQIEKEYVDALSKIELNSHLWILSWFHEANRNKLKIAPKRIDEKLPEFGVFALRAPIRPNPVALSLVKLLKVDHDKLYVENYDAIDGTPIVDIKPYFENDCIFSPTTPAIFPASREMKLEQLTLLAYNHHREMCRELAVAVRMALIANVELGILANPEVTLHITGSPCFIDSLQGITRARFANPARLSIENSESELAVTWKKGTNKLLIRFKETLLNLQSLTVDEIFQKESDQLFEVK